MQDTTPSAESVEEQLPRLVVGNRDLSLVHTVDDEPSVQEILLDGLPDDDASDIPLEAAPAAGLSSDRVLKRYSHIGLGLAATDLICIITALFLAQIISHGVSSPYPTNLTAPLVTSLLWTPLFYCFGLYSIQHLPASEEFRRIIGACSFGILLVVLLSYLSEVELSGAFVTSALAMALGFELAGRRIWRLTVGRLKNGGRLTLRTLVVGTNDEAHRLAEVLKRRGLGFAPIGYVGSPGAPSPNSLPLLGHFNSLVELIREHEAECLFVASTALKAEDMLKVVQAARRTGAEVRVSANLPEILTTRLSVQTVANDLMAITLRPVRLTRGSEGNEAELRHRIRLSWSADEQPCDASGRSRDKAHFSWSGPVLPAAGYKGRQGIHRLQVQDHAPGR